MKKIAISMLAFWSSSAFAIQPATALDPVASIAVGPTVLDVSFQVEGIAGTEAKASRRAEDKTRSNHVKACMEKSNTTRICKPKGKATNKEDGRHVTEVPIVIDKNHDGTTETTTMTVVIQKKEGKCECTRRR